MGRERRLRPGSREPRAREAKANSGVPRVLGPPRLIRPPRTTDPDSGEKRSDIDIGMRQCPCCVRKRVER